MRQPCDRFVCYEKAFPVPDLLAVSPFGHSMRSDVTSDSCFFQV
jgi:hypothetical protein